MAKCGIAFLLYFLCCLNQAEGEVYHIRPESTNDCSSCLTLSQFAANSSSLLAAAGNATLILHPGQHSLFTTLHISDVGFLSISPFNQTAQVSCDSLSGFLFTRIQYVQISNVEFAGCGQNKIQRVEEFVLSGAVFQGQNDSGTALEFIDTVAQIINSSFKSNRNGTLRTNDSLHSDVFWAGGAIVATRSNISITSSLFESNAAEVGGVIYAEQQCLITIENTTFIDNHAIIPTMEPTSDTLVSHGGVLYQESGSIQITDCQFVNNSAEPGRGGVLHANNSNVLISVTQFIGNLATFGGVLHSNASSVSTDDSQFSSNSATFGGVMQSSSSDITINRSHFRDNSADFGGVLGLSNGHLALNDSQFDQNSARRGGMLYQLGGSEVLITGSQINGSTAASGGAIHSNASELIVLESQFNDNSATDVDVGGGGVFYAHFSNVTVNGSRFHNNKAAAGEGGIFNCIGSHVRSNNNHFHDSNAVRGAVMNLIASTATEGGSYFGGNRATYGGVFLVSYIGSALNVTGGSRFSENTAGDQGGVVYSIYGKVSVNGSELDGNSATVGGVMYSYESTAVIHQSIIRRSMALNGGVIDTLLSNITLIRTAINNNTATSTGVFTCSESSNFLLVQCDLNNNTANTRILQCSNSNVTVADSLGYGNKGSRGGLLYLFNGHVSIINSQVNNSRADNKNSGGVLYASRCTVHIHDSLFHNNTATDEGGVLYSINSKVTIETSHFSENVGVFNGGSICSIRDVITVYRSVFFDCSSLVGGAIYSNLGNISVDGTEFVANGAMWGGAIDSFASTVEITRCEFDGNVVFSGGGALRSDRGAITIRRSCFTNNTASRFGGALHLFNCSVTVRKSEFYVNEAPEGSVLYSVENTILAVSLAIANNTAENFGTFYLFESRILLSETTFSSNVGSLFATDSSVNFTDVNTFDSNSHFQTSVSNFEEGGALTVYQSTVFFDGTIKFESNQAESGGAIHSTESTLSVVGTVTIAGNTAARNGGGVYLSQSRAFCEPNSTFWIVKNSASQRGGGVHAAGSSIQIIVTASETLLTIEDNEAMQGGGLSLESNAKLYIVKREDFRQPSAAVRLTHNTADYGGALYVNDETNAATCETPSTECFFQVLGIHRLVLPDINTISMHISENVARISGRTLYGGLLDRCRVSPLAEVHNRNPDINRRFYQYNGSGLDYFHDSVVTAPDAISSDPVQVCFCFDNLPDCSYLQLDRALRVRKGESFTVSLAAVDQGGKMVNTFIQSSLNHSGSGLAEGQLFQRVKTTCTDLMFNVFSSNPREVLTLYANGPCSDADLSKRNVTIRFRKCTCPVGFEPTESNATACNCNCHREIRTYARQCDIETESFVRRVVLSNAWISFSNVTGYLVYPNCPYDYCLPLSDETPINLNEPNGSDALCAFNRVSLLCGSCAPGFSLSLGSSRCLECPNYWPALFVIITLVAVFAGVALVALLLFLNLTVAVGSLNGLIFYVNIVAVNKTIFFPYQGNPSFASVFISFLNLDFGIDACFFDGMTTYGKTWLRLAFPIYVILIVISLIVISSYSTRFSNLIGKRDPVATLATLILLSYARLLGVSFAALSAGTLRFADNSRKIVWLADATITYFTKEHIPLFLIAVLIVIIVVMYTAILLLWQLLVRLPKWKLCGWMRNQKLKFFIETYAAPYTPRYRYWTGLLLLARIVLYLSAALNVSNDPFLALTAIAFTMVCILCLKAVVRGRVFKKWPVDLLETFFYFNTLFLTIFTWYATNGRISQAAVTNVSVSFAFIVLLLVISYHIYTYTGLFSKLRKTKFGTGVEKLFETKAKSNQPTIQVSEENDILDMVYRPINPDGYTSQLSIPASVQHGPTQSVIDIITKRKRGPPGEEGDQERSVPPLEDTASDGGMSNVTEKELLGQKEGLENDESEL